MTKSFRVLSVLFLTAGAFSLVSWNVVGPRLWLHVLVRGLVIFGLAVGAIGFWALLRASAESPSASFAALPVVGLVVLLLLGPALRLSVDEIVITNQGSVAIDRIEVAGPGFEADSGHLPVGSSVSLFVTPTNEGSVSILAETGGQTRSQEIFLLELLNEVVHVEFS